MRVWSYADILALWLLMEGFSRLVHVVQFWYFVCTTRISNRTILQWIPAGHSNSVSFAYHRTQSHKWLACWIHIQYLKTQPSAKVALLLERRVFPLYLMVAPSPYVLANANWMLGQLAHCLPEVIIIFLSLSLSLSFIPTFLLVSLEKNIWVYLTTWCFWLWM